MESFFGVVNQRIIMYIVIRFETARGFSG